MTNVEYTSDRVNIVRSQWGYKGTAYGCMNCGFGVTVPIYNYCPNCGAKMDEGVVGKTAPDLVAVVRCKDCVYFNDMSDMGKSSFCDLHTDHSDGVEFEEMRLFYTNPDGYCAWGNRCDDSIPANVDNVEAIIEWEP